MWNYDNALYFSDVLSNTSRDILTIFYHFGLCITALNSIDLLKDGINRPSLEDSTLVYPK